MDKVDLDDLNRRLAFLCTRLWFTPTVRRISPNDPRLLFQAVTWRDGKRFEHTALFSISEVARLGPVAAANAFVENARAALPRGSVQP